MLEPFCCLKRRTQLLHVVLVGERAPPSLDKNFQRSSINHYETKELLYSRNSFIYEQTHRYSSPSSCDFSRGAPQIKENEEIISGTLGGLSESRGGIKEIKEIEETN